MFDVLSKVKEDKVQKSLACKNIYTFLQGTCRCCIASNKILPTKADLLNFVELQMKDSEAHGKLHAHLIQVMDNLQPIATKQHLASHICKVLNDPAKG